MWYKVLLSVHLLELLKLWDLYHPDICSPLQSMVPDSSSSSLCLPQDLSAAVASKASVTKYAYIHTYMQACMHTYIHTYMYQGSDLLNDSSDNPRPYQQTLCSNIQADEKDVGLLYDMEFPDFSSFFNLPFNASVRFELQLGTSSW